MSKPELYTDKEIAQFMITECMKTYTRGAIDKLRELYTTLTVMQARNPKMEVSNCLAVIDDWKTKLEEEQ